MNLKRLRQLMRLMGLRSIYGVPRSSVRAKELPHLLRGMVRAAQPGVVHRHHLHAAGEGRAT